MLDSHYRYQLVRKQAERIADLLSNAALGFCGVLLGKRRQGKTDLLRQAHARLFERAEGVLPFIYTVQASQDNTVLAEDYCAAFCNQVRAFLMRQEDDLEAAPISLDRELERAGLPLTLVEMMRRFTTLPADRRLAFAASLPADFSRHEMRPVCVLLDDAHNLDRASPLLLNLKTSKTTCLLSGRYPFVASIAGETGWPVFRMEEFSGDDAVAYARTLCEAVGLGFYRDAWERWCEIEGTSLWLIYSLVIAASIRGSSIASTEDLAGLYIQELASGMLGKWLSSRLNRAVPDRVERIRVGELLMEVARSGTAPIPLASLRPHVWNGLIAEEWAEDDLAGPRILLDDLQRDWLSVASSGHDQTLERAKARMVQSFIVRAEQLRERPESARFSTVIRQRLLDLPQLGFPDSVSWAGQEIRLPKIVSVSNEAAGTAELFWCYGFFEDGGDIQGRQIVLLIAVCDQPFSNTELQRWQRLVETEARLVASASSARYQQRSTIHHELWLVVPPETSLTPSSNERRFSWQVFFRLLVQPGFPEHG